MRQRLCNSFDEHLMIFVGEYLNKQSKSRIYQYKQFAKNNFQTILWPAQQMMQKIFETYRFCMKIFWFFNFVFKLLFKCWFNVFAFFFWIENIRSFENQFKDGRLSYLETGFFFLRFYGFRCRMDWFTHIKWITINAIWTMTFHFITRDRTNCIFSTHITAENLKKRLEYRKISINN